MKIIDLLNKIANGEEVPDNFKYRAYLFYYDEYNNCYFEEGHKNLFDILAYLKGWSLTDEVEIIEEEKKIPEKLEYYRGLKKVSNDCELDDLEYAIESGNKNFEMFLNKINEIIDHLKSKGE